MQLSSSGVRQHWWPVTEENPRQCKALLVEAGQGSELRVFISFNFIEIKCLPFWGFSLFDHFADGSRQSAVSSADVCYCRLCGSASSTRAAHDKWRSGGSLASFPTRALSCPLWTWAFDWRRRGTRMPSSTDLRLYLWMNYLIRLQEVFVMWSEEPC